MRISLPTLRAWLIFAALVATVYVVESAPTEVDKAIALYRGGDYAAAAEIYRRLAEEGDAAAQFNLAGMYRDGMGVSRNAAEAMSWLQKSAEQGSVIAQVELSSAYSYGRGVSIDRTKAMMWYTIAEMEGGPCMAEHYRVTMPVEGMTGADVAEAERLAREWLQKHASTRRRFFEFPPSCD